MYIFICIYQHMRLFSVFKLDPHPISNICHVLLGTLPSVKFGLNPFRLLLAITQTSVTMRADLYHASSAEMQPRYSRRSSARVGVSENRCTCAGNGFKKNFGSAAPQLLGNKISFCTCSRQAHNSAAPFAVSRPFLGVGPSFERQCKLRSGENADGNNTC